MRLPSWARVSGSAKSSCQKECKCERHMICEEFGTLLRVAMSRKPTVSDGRCPPAPSPSRIGASKPRCKKCSKPSWLTCAQSKGNSSQPSPSSCKLVLVAGEQPSEMQEMPSARTLATCSPKRHSSSCERSGGTRAGAAQEGLTSMASSSSLGRGLSCDASNALSPPRPCSPQCVSSAQAATLAMSGNRIASTWRPTIQSSAKRMGLPYGGAGAPSSLTWWDPVRK
mmetsp:Transcript_75436/g.230729  ORF Transcript_75436/g.230729 Transcript_75436/m.230729 type:complete len:226 (-) Transcript_75436:611-1288(-)